MSLTKPQLIIVAAAGAIVLILILIVLGVLPGLKNTANDPTKVVASLKFWGSATRPMPTAAPSLPSKPSTRTLP